MSSSTGLHLCHNPPQHFSPRYWCPHIQFYILVIVLLRILVLVVGILIYIFVIVLLSILVLVVGVLTCSLDIRATVLLSIFHSQEGHVSHIPLSILVLILLSCPYLQLGHLGRGPHQHPCPHYSCRALISSQDTLVTNLLNILSPRQANMILKLTFSTGLGFLLHCMHCTVLYMPYAR